MATDIIARGMASEAERAANKYVAGTNISFIPQEDGTVKITASGDVSSEDDVARELINNHKIDMNNPHNVTAEQLGLGNVDNTSDISKPISKATQNALDGKSNTNHTHTTYDSHIENVEIHVTAEEKAAWSAINYSNPNLLINPDFAVNQRGTTSASGGTSTVYIADRWFSQRAIISRPENGGISIAWDVTNKDNGWTQQKIETAALFGKTVTISADIDGERKSVTTTVPTLVNKTDGGWVDSNKQVMLAVSNLGGTLMSIVIFSYTTTPITISNVKLELGSTPTPYCPPDPAAELAKCQRYYQIRSTGDIAAVDMRPSMATIKDIKQRSDGNYEYIAEL